MNQTRLTAAPPFDGTGLMRYFASHAVAGIESGGSEQFLKNIRMPTGEIAQLSVALDGSNGLRSSLNGESLPPSLVPRVRQLFDLDADSRRIDAHLAADSALTETVLGSPGIRLPGAFDPSEQLLRTMVGQQISIAAARTTLARLSLELDGNGAFPTAAQFATDGLRALRGPASRVFAVHNAALALDSGALQISADLSFAELSQRLTALPGVGAWTAGYVAIRVLSAPDVLLATDLVLQKGAAKLGIPANPRELIEYSRRWAPYRSYAGMHLWRVAQQGS